MLSVQIVLTFFALIYFLYFRVWNYQTYIMFRIRPRNEIVKDTDRSTNYQILWAKYGRWLKNRFLCNKYLKNFVFLTKFKEWCVLVFFGSAFFEVKKVKLKEVQAVSFQLLVLVAFLHMHVLPFTCTRINLDRPTCYFNYIFTENC